MGGLLSRASPAPAPVSPSKEQITSPKFGEAIEPPSSPTNSEGKNSDTLVSSEESEKTVTAELEADGAGQAASDDAVAETPSQHHSVRFSEEDMTKPATTSKSYVSDDEPPEIDPGKALMGWVYRHLYTLVEDIAPYYQFSSCIGRGADAIVFKAAVVAAETATTAHTPDAPEDGDAVEPAPKEVAIKLLQKKRLMANNGRRMHKLRGELALWQKLHHPNLLELLQVVELPDNVCVSCELASEELFDRLAMIEHFDEVDCKLVGAQLAAGLAHLHLVQKVAHRDIKTANILCLHERPTEYGCIKIADFGYAVEFESYTSSTFEDNCGTLEYYAPELCENMLARLRRDPTITYTAGVDCWALGCVLYECLTGQPPYWSEDDTEQIHLILRARLDLNDKTRLDEGVRNVSAECKSLLRGLLNPNANTRLSMTEVLTHPWFATAATTGAPEAAPDCAQEHSAFPMGQSPVERRLFPVLPEAAPNGSPRKRLARRTGERRRTKEYRTRFANGFQPSLPPMQVDGNLVTDLSAVTKRKNIDSREIEAHELKNETVAGGQVVRDRRSRRTKEASGDEMTLAALVQAVDGEDTAWKGPYARRDSEALVEDISQAMNVLNGLDSKGLI